VLVLLIMITVIYYPLLELVLGLVSAWSWLKLSPSFKFSD